MLYNYYDSLTLYNYDIVQLDYLSLSSSCHSLFVEVVPPGDGEPDPLWHWFDDPLQPHCHNQKEVLKSKHQPNHVPAYGAYSIAYMTMSLYAT